MYPESTCLCGSTVYAVGCLVHNCVKHANATRIHDKHLNILSETKSAFRTSGPYYSHAS